MKTSEHREVARSRGLKGWTVLKADFHFNRIVTYRSIFFCVETISSTLVLGNKEIRYVSVRYG